VKSTFPKKHFFFFSNFFDFRLLHTLYRWLEDHFDEFLEDKILWEIFSKFVEELPSNSGQTAEKLKLIIKNRVRLFFQRTKKKH
jgi:hypothetical protein